MAELTDEELQRNVDRAAGRKGISGKVADMFDPTTRKDADAAAKELARRKAAADAAKKAAEQPASAPKELQFKKGGAVKGWGKARGGKAAKIG